MINGIKIDEIKKHIEKAQSPVFFFDNDADGLCSFLLLRRAFGTGKGVCVKGELTKDYFRKVDEFKPDYIFILDKPVVSGKFFEKIKEINLPVVWIDHHDFQKEDIPDFVNYYNPLADQDISYPVSHFCYQISNSKSDLWIACVGCIADKFVPPYYDEFEKKYPDLSCKYDDAFDLRYKARIGKIIRIFNFALKDRITNIITMLRFLLKVKSPYEIFEENKENYYMHKRFNFIEKKYRVLIKKAIEHERLEEDILFFKYKGDMSISSDLADELRYVFPNKLIVVAYVREAIVNISIRGDNALKIFKRVSKGMEGVGGGGHEKAIGVRMNIGLLDEFEKRFRDAVKESI